MNHIKPQLTLPMFQVHVIPLCKDEGGLSRMQQTVAENFISFT